MRSLAFPAFIYAATVGTASAVYATERTRVDVGATGYDKRTSEPGCSPDGCAPENTRDGDTSANSRWSCKGDILGSSDDDEGCCITYYFEDPLDVRWARVAFHKGDERTRTLDLYVNGDYHCTASEKFLMLGYQSLHIYRGGTEEIKLCLNDPEANRDVWLSITEVYFLVV